MERSDRPNERQVLLGLRDSLRDAIAELENLGFHHETVGTVERHHYDRVVRMEARVDNQIGRWPAQVSAEQSPTKTNYVAALPAGERDVSSGSGECDGGEPAGVDSGQPGQDDPEDRG